MGKSELEDDLFTILGMMRANQGRIHVGSKGLNFCMTKPGELAIETKFFFF